jgi:hypothetical protein
MSRESISRTREVFDPPRRIYSLGWSRKNRFMNFRKEDGWGAMGSTQLGHCSRQRRKDQRFALMMYQ